MADIKYVITVDSTGAVKNVQDFDKAIETLGKGTDTTKGKSQSFGSELSSKLIPSFTAASLIANGVTKTLKFLGDQFISTFTNAMEAERIDRGLNSALEITGRLVPGLAEDLTAYASEIQRMTVFDDEAIKGVETLLVQMTNLDVEGIQRATRGTIGLASVMNMDLQSAAQLVQKALEGNFGALSRYGIKVDETLPLEEKRAQLMERLEKMFQRATAETDTASGSLAQMKNTIGDAKEKIGNVFLPVLSVGAKAVGDLVGKLAGLNTELEKIDGRAKRAAASNEIYADTFYLITARAGRTSEYVTNLAKLYDYNYESIILMIEAGKYGEELEAEWNKERDKTNAKLKAQKDSWEALEKGTRSGAEGSSDAAKKLQQTIQGLIDQADPLRTKYHGIVDSMILVDKAHKAGKISATDYGKVMDWLQTQLREVEKPIIKLGTTELPKISRQMQNLIDYVTAPKNMPKPFFSDWKDDLQEFGEKAESVMSKVQAVSSQVYGQLDAIAAQSQKNKEIALDNEYQKRLETLKATVTNEEEQRAAIEALDAEYDIKRRSLQHSAAKQQKAASLAQAIINVAEGVSKALAQGGIFGPIFAAAVAALGAVQIKLIAQQPLPFKEGNVFSRLTTMYTPSGRQVQMGDGGEPEILSPESKLRKIMREEIRRAGGGAGAAQPAMIVLELDGQRVGQVLVPYLGKLSNRGRGGVSVRTLVRSEA
jgi:hypothetical protein